MSYWWVSWYHHWEEHGPFTLHSPWWISSSDAEGRDGICAAVRAEDEEGAMEVVLSSFDRRSDSVEWRFVEWREDGWSPFGSRFPKAEWMAWEEDKTCNCPECKG